MLEALLALIAAAITAAPELIKDVEALIADAKAAGAGGNTGAEPIAPGVTLDMAALEAKLIGK